MRRIFVGAAAVAAVLVGPRVARAGDGQEQQLAQALFDEARRLIEQKRYAQACPKLVESQRLDPGGGTLLNIAVCHEKDGKLATAKLDYEEALASAVHDGRKDRQQIARERISALDATIPRISVLVPAESAGEEIKLDGMVLRRAAWGVATPVDPGAHVIEATAPNRAPWTTSVVVEASQKTKVDVPALAQLAPLPQGAPVRVTSPDAPESPPVYVLVPVPPEAVAAERGRANPLYYTALTVTLVAAGTSAVFGVLAFAANKEAKNAGCLPDRAYCPDQASADAADRSSTFAWVSTVALGTAAVGVVAMIVLPQRTSPSRPSVRGTAAALPGGGSVGLAGAF